LLYAVLQDLVRSELLLHGDAEGATPLADVNADLKPFDPIYRTPPLGAAGKDILFPIHVSVPMAFDTYGRRAWSEGPDAEGRGRRNQTDKGFRGKFLEFLSCDEANYFDNHLIRVLRNLFARTEGLTPLDHALVDALKKRIVGSKLAELQRVPGFIDSDSDWWSLVYEELPEKSEFWPLQEFARQGQRLGADVQAIAHTPGLARIERVAFVERLLFYHFGLFMVRLSRNLYRELDWACQVLHSERAGPEYRPWAGRDLCIRYHSAKARVLGVPQAEYEAMMQALNEAYLLLPVLNNLELAVRVASGESPQSGPLRWTEARQKLERADPAQRKLAGELVALLGEYGREIEQLDPAADDLLRLAPVSCLFDGVRRYYSMPDNRRYPRDHHQTVFESVVRSGPESMVANRPAKHFRLGDELIYLLVLAMFEKRDILERDDTTMVPRARRKLLRGRLPLADFELRLEEDLLFPADHEATEDLRSSLARLGLLDRLSDVGEANFLRHPTGV